MAIQNASVASLSASTEHFGNHRRGGGPRLSADEWTVLLDIHLRSRSGTTAARTSDIDRAVDTLAKIASRVGQARAGAQLRSRNGLLRRMTVLRALDRGEFANAPREAREIWQRFQSDSVACARAAAMINHREDIGPNLGSTAIAAPITRSHGPVPVFGSFSVTRDDGANHVYLMEFVADRPIAAVIASSDRAVLKLGRTNDLERRRAELNQGFPPGIGLEWRLLALVTCASAAAAHALEQSLLDRLEAKGACLGREFLLINRDNARAMFAHFAAAQPRDSLGSSYALDQLC
ncbi:GIY-YIG nuclease family protein [Bosea sp. NPDC055332]